MSAENKLLTLFRDEVKTKVDAERIQALTDVSGIMGWLTYDPPLSREKLFDYVLIEFERANKNQDPILAEKINFYKRLNKTTCAAD